MELTTVATGIRGVIGVVPVLRGALRWLVSRTLTLEVQPASNFYIQVGENAIVWGRIRLRMVNHRADRKEHVIGCHAELKRRRFVLWHRTLYTVPVVMVQSRKPLDIELPPLSNRAEVALEMEGSSNKWKLPSESELFLVLELAGPIKKIERLLTRVRHDTRTTIQQP